MDFTVNKLEEVWTVDEKKLGVANAVYHRSEGANPELKYYASYLHIQNFDYGDDYYIPTEFIKGRDDKTGLLVVDKTFNEVLKNTWTRMPEFILHGNGRIEKLTG
jgi:hypothetical protein